MHRIVIDEPYKFVPPYRGKWLSWAFRFVLKPYLRKNYGIIKVDYSGLEHVRESIRAGHGILICPNHSRDSDPMLLGMLCRKIPSHVYSMASWHIFKQSAIEGFVVRRLGGFSIYREGLDRQALDTAVQIVETAERPLVIFPEGVISRANDRLNPLMEGVSFVARVAAKKRAEKSPDKKVVIHPVAIRYRLVGDLMDSIGPTLKRLEERTFWKSHEDLPVIERIRRLALAYMASREVEILGDCQHGPLKPRVALLLNAILHPFERQWLGKARTGDVISRVKELRAAIVPGLLRGTLSEAETRQRWRQLTDCYYAQTMAMYPDDYLEDGVRGALTPERIAETVHRIEEDMTDKVTPHPSWRVEFSIGEAIEVDPGRKPRGVDPLMDTLRRRMLELLKIEDWWPPEPVQIVDTAKALQVAAG
jgi:1-acyl-sn-glycerol-3-phosphate acyltransferase